MSLRKNLNVLEKTVQSFSIPIEKEVTKIDKDDNETVVTTS